MERKKILARAVGMSLTLGLLTVPFVPAQPDTVEATAQAEAAAPVKAADV